MGVPGMKPKYEVRGKVRTGIKVNGKPRSVDYFLSDDPELAELFGDKPSKIRIRFAHSSVDDAFSTGLEWWTRRKSDKKNQLACYTKDSSDAPVALRMEAYGTDGFEVVGPKKDIRIPIRCQSRDCPILKKGDCKPMGRLVFFLDGGRSDAVLQLDTKSWNTIERLEPLLAAAGDLRGRVWELAVAFESKGAKRFPVLSIQEVAVNVNTEQDVAIADKLVPLLGALTATYPGADEKNAAVRAELAGALDETNPGWRDKAEFVDRIKEIGVVKAAEGLLSKYDLLPA